MVRNTPDGVIRKALHTSSVTFAVAVAVKHMTRSALISSTNRATWVANVSKSAKEGGKDRTGTFQIVGSKRVAPLRNAYINCCSRSRRKRMRFSYLRDAVCLVNSNETDTTLNKFHALNKSLIVQPLRGTVNDL